LFSRKVEIPITFYGEKWAIIGKSGSGKSYSARVVIEEGRALGVTFVVVDPQDAYGNLDGFEYLIAKKVKSAEGLGVLVSRTGKNVVIRTKGITITEQQDFLKKFLKSFRVHMGRGIRCIVIDEAHKFAPEYDKAASKDEVRSMSQENRSDGLGFIAVEQRTQRLDKTVLSQADHIVIHQLTAYRDLKAVEPYLDHPEDLQKIKRLKVGEVYLSGFGDAPMIEKVRRAATEHTGNSPESLITEDTSTWERNIKKVYPGGIRMENITEQGELVKGVVPSVNGFMDLVAAGAKMSLGLGLAGVVSAFASRWPSPIPFISTRTLASGLTTIVLYAGYRYVKHETVKSILGYAAAGAAVHTAGSLVFDILAALKVNVPGFVNFAIMSATGVPPVAVESSGGIAESGDGASPDLNTQFA